MADQLYAGSASRESQCTASHIYSASFPGSNAFDGDVSSEWISERDVIDVSGSCWLQWDYGSGKKISQMRMAARSSGADNQFPEDVGLFGSDTGDFSGEETHLQDFTLSQPASAGEWCDWVTISSPQSFRYLRVEIYSKQAVPGQSSEDWVSVAETEFMEQIPSPSVTTDSASDVTETSATLNGTLDDLSGESSVDVYFEYGATTSYGSTTTAQTLSATGAFSDDLTGLTAEQAYHFRAAVTDGVSTWYGDDRTFLATELTGGQFFTFPF